MSSLPHPEYPPPYPPPPPVPDRPNEPLRPYGVDVTCPLDREVVTDTRPKPPGRAPPLKIVARGAGL
jgi:hypothetical protein